LGKRCIIKTDDNAVFKKYSLVVAISNRKCLGYKLYENGAVNADRFNDFLKEILKDTKNKLIILDNGQIHKKENIKNTILESGNKLLYTCPNIGKLRKYSSVYILLFLIFNFKIL
jgi:hypothetical protein